MSKVALCNAFQLVLVIDCPSMRPHIKSDKHTKRASAQLYFVDEVVKDGNGDLLVEQVVYNNCSQKTWNSIFLFPNAGTPNG